MLQYKNETVETFKKLYTERKDTIEYLEKFGNRFEKAQAMLIKEIAGISDIKNALKGLAAKRGHFDNSSSPIKGDD